MHDIFLKLQQLAVIPVIKITDTSKSIPLAKALVDGGLACAEVTFRTSNAAEAIQNITQAMGDDIFVGAGTVLTVKQVDDAVSAGAKFIVSPGLNPDVVRHCQNKNIPVLPGVCTPTEIEQALSLGLDVLKFFPAEAAGGLNMIKALSAPYGDVLFVPTGGIDTNNLASYLSFKKVLACGGSWMVKEEFIDSGDFTRITNLTREAAQIVNTIKTGRAS